MTIFGVASHFEVDLVIAQRELDSVGTGVFKKLCSRASTGTIQ
jgi:hypothetical protein